MGKKTGVGCGPWIELDQAWEQGRDGEVEPLELVRPEWYVPFDVSRPPYESSGKTEVWKSRECVEIVQLFSEIWEFPAFHG